MYWTRSMPPSSTTTALVCPPGAILLLIPSKAVFANPLNRLIGVKVCIPVVQHCLYLSCRYNSTHGWRKGFLLPECRSLNRGMPTFLPRWVCRIDFSFHRSLPQADPFYYSKKPQANTCIMDCAAGYVR